MEQSIQPEAVVPATSQRSISVGLAQSAAPQEGVTQIASCLQPSLQPSGQMMHEMAGFTADEPPVDDALASDLDYIIPEATHEAAPLELFESDPIGSPLITGLDMISHVLGPQPLTPPALELTPPALKLRQSTLSLTEPSTSTTSGGDNPFDILDKSGSILNEAQIVLSTAESNAYSLVFKSVATIPGNHII